MAAPICSRRLVGWALLVSALGCGSPSAPSDAAVDASADASASIDASIDASAPADASTPDDASASVDASMPDDAGAMCGSLGAVCDTLRACGAPLECAGGSGAALGVCAPIGASCIGDECGADAPICLFTSGSSVGRCVTAAERGCVCRGPIGRMVFDCEGLGG